MESLKYIAAGLLLFIGVNNMSAQQGKTLQSKKVQTERAPNKLQKNPNNKMQERLSLTAEQTKEIESIRSKRAEKILKLREQIWNLKEEERKEIHEVLTPEQREKSEKLREQSKERMKMDRRSKENKQKKSIKQKRTHR